MTEKNKKTIAIVIYPGFSLLELVGATHVWISATMMSPYQTVVVGSTTDFIPSSTPLKMKAQKTFTEVPKPYALILVGGGSAAYQAMQDTTLMDYIRSAAESAELIASFRTGALILGEAGLLQGKSATTHWAYADKLVDYGAEYQRKNWVEAGKIFTGAGVSSAVDLSLLLVARLRGEQSAKQVQIMSEWDPHPPFGGIDWNRVTAELRPRRIIPTLGQKSQSPWSSTRG